MVLNKNQYAPLNSQNTLHLYNAFFALVFPLKVTFRECDILRGYIAIRLLNEINGRVSFIAPNAFQLRNAHSYHKDYLEEKRLYESIYYFVNDLERWKCHKNSIQECIIDLVEALIEANHLNESELELYKAWINDLTKIGYKWPKLVKVNSEKNDSESNQIIYKSTEKDHSSNTNENEKSFSVLKANSNKKTYLENYCTVNLDSNDNSCSFEHLLLITQASNIEDLHFITHFLNTYFPYTVICTESNSFEQFLEYISSNSSFDAITILMSNDFKSCIDATFKIGFKQQSFLIVKNVKKFNFWSDATLIEKENPLKGNDLTVFDKSFYLIRRTVANAIRLVNLKSQNDTKASFCEFYKLNKQAMLCSTLKREISSLIWHSNDLASESCEDIEKSKIWIPEVHDGPRADLTSTLAYLGQNPILAGYKYSRSPFPEAIQLGKVMAKIPKAIANNAIMPIESIRQVYDFYKNDQEFKDTDFVISSFYPCWAETFIPLNKTIIFNPAHRYNLGRCTKAKWKKLNSNLFMLQSKSKLILSSMSKYDAEYTGYFTGLFGYRLYAYGGFYAKNVTFNPIKNSILVGPTNNAGSMTSHINELNKYSLEKKYNYTFKHIREEYRHYTLDQLANHRAIILFPYAAMSYSITDFYISKIPIFVPSWKIWKGIVDRSIRYHPYCGSKNTDIEKFPKSLHKYSPNELYGEAYDYWAKYADYYQWPHVTVYETLEDLFIKLETSDFQKISDQMKDFNEIKEADLLDNWCKILKKRDLDAKIPASFEEALKYFNTDSFQV